MDFHTLINFVPFYSGNWSWGMHGSPLKNNLTHSGKRLNGGILLGGGLGCKFERSWSWLVNMESSSNKKETTS